MYEAFFNFRTRPFSSVPEPKHYYASEPMEAARRGLERAIERAEGPGLVIGAPGTGKTLLCRLLAQRFNGPFAIAFLSCGRLKTCQALLQAIHYELGLEYRGLDEGELRLSLIDFLEPSQDGPQGLLLLVDEAHTLPFRLLDEVRLITNLIRDGQPRVRVVLAGGPVLEERFASPKLLSFAQRIAVRCYLEPLNRAETHAYVRAQIVGAGGEPSRIIDDEAMQSVYRATDGIPRLINQVCDHALVLAAVGGHSRLTSDAIDEAWSDLQQLPGPWCPEESDADGSQIVEFGHLPDDDARPESIPFAANRQPAPPVVRPLLRVEAADETPVAAVENSSPVVVSRVPEVELDFPEFGDPFSEEFAEEELVLNQYAADIEIFADVPRVSSWEGRQIGALLNSQRAEVPREPASFCEPLDGVSILSAASDPVLPDEDDELEQPSPVEAELPEAPLEYPVGVSETRPESQSYTTRSLAELVRPSGERTKIVIENHPPSEVVKTTLARSRGVEFRQLFSKLRRG